MTSAPTAAQAVEIARWVESRGWKPTPLHVVGPDSRTCTCPKGGNCGRSAGKHNIAKDWSKDARGSEIFVEMAEGRSPRFDKEGKPAGFWAPRPKMNVGILTGEASGVFVLDIDPKDSGFESMKAFVAEHGPMPQTFIVKTGSGGFHYYFQMPDFDGRNSASKIAPGIDIRANGGMVVGPGSVSYAGPYTIQFDAPVAPAPAWLLDLIRPAAPSDSQTHVGSSASAEAARPVDPFAGSVSSPEIASSAAPAPSSSGQQTRQQAAYETAIVTGELRRLTQLAAAGWNGEPWDITTFQVACQLLELANAPWSRLSVDEARQQFLEHCPPAEPGYDPTAKWTSAVQRIGDKARPEPTPSAAPATSDAFDGWEAVGGPPDPRSAAGANREDAPAAGPFSLSDLGNAERLIAWHGGIIRFANDASTWLTYDRGVWSSAAGEVQAEAYLKSAMKLARDNEVWLHSDQIRDVEAKNPKSDRDDFVSWCGKTEMYTRVSAGVKMARSDARLQTTMMAFDADPMMFNASNCAVNLATGEALEHHPSQMFRHQGRVAYNPGATCPMWDSFLRRTQPDPEMRRYLQMVLGYSMTGRMDEHAIFIHNGPGATGKSTFLEVVMAVMGNYGQKLDRETLLSKGAANTSIPADIARMAGARFLAASETATGRKLDDERVKELVGGDTMTARHLHKDFFDFQPTGKIHMATNHLPGFESGGDGMGRRLRLVPWEVIIPKPERDKTLKDRIIATEAEGVFAWLVRGAMMWVEAGGLSTPVEVEKRSDEHIEEADPVWPFIRERLEVDDPDYATEFQMVYGAYESWCSLNGHRPMSGRAFSMSLRERLGADSKFLAPGSRRSMFRVRVRMQPVPAHHQQYAHGLG
jgi:putative DNA primase/helicase